VGNHANVDHRGRSGGRNGRVAWQELVVKLTHIAAGLGLVAAWALLVAGFLKKPVDAGILSV